ncbi:MULTISPECIES: S9 family peptidase [unclassified Dysgonomonas]|uniref:S9 family peptidase n=1 Tax=unclassified Dysgonomonas TaxID=2630389 RepID=UPI00247619DF|nr:MULTISPECIES: S9 family peptidase [unclassified Dysgonomonas]
MTLTIPAQQSGGYSLSLDDLIPGGSTYNNYRPQMPHNLRWWGDKLLCVEGDSVISVSLTEKGKKEVLFTLEGLNGLFQSKNKKISTINALSFPYPDKDNIIAFDTETDNGMMEKLLFDLEKRDFIASFVYPKNAGNLDFSPQSNRLAYTVDNNLFVSLAGVVSPLAVSAEEEEYITYGGADVHRNEFGITKGTSWSPKGTMLAFYRMDQTMVGDYPLVDISAREAKLKNIKYPMAGMNSHEVTVGVYNPANRTVIYLKTGLPKEKYLTNIAWSPDEKSIYVAEVNRGQDTCLLNRYNAETGELEATLFTETNSRYVEPEHPVLFLKNTPSQFVWQSERDGHNHLYLYNTDGKLLKQITSGRWDVLSVVGFDEKGENLFIVSAEESPIENHIYKLNIKTGIRTKLSGEAGMHTALLSVSGRYICDTYSSLAIPGKVAVIDTKSDKVHIVHEAKNPFEGIDMPEITVSHLKANDGKTDLYYRMVKPTDFNPSEKYPVVIYVYGGPHSQMVNNGWNSVRGWDIYMAQKGYIVFTLDNRGTSYRGHDFESITHRRLGIVETQDQMTGVEYLKSLPYVDANRIGVHGWSFGGFMTLNLMLRHPETFKVGVAGGPVTDWKYYEIMYGERYMDSPQENPEGYKETNMVDRAGDLSGRLLIIHGDEDPTVVMQHSLQFLKSAISNGTHPDFFVYPGHGHNMRGKDRVHLHEHITRYFDNFLK